MRSLLIGCRAKQLAVNEAASSRRSFYLVPFLSFVHPLSLYIYTSLFLREISPEKFIDRGCSSKQAACSPFFPLVSLAFRSFFFPWYNPKLRFNGKQFRRLLLAPFFLQMATEDPPSLTLFPPYPFPASFFPLTFPSPPRFLHPSNFFPVSCSRRFPALH